MRNVIFAPRDALLLESAATRGGGLIRGWIVGTTESLFRGKERGIFEIKRLTARREAAQPATKLAYEVHLRVRNVCPRECALRKFRCFEPFERDLQQFSAALNGRRKRAYLRYYIENIQRDEILREEESYPTRVWPHDSRALITMLRIKNNLLK